MMPNDENFKREASKEDPSGFEKLEKLANELLSIPKAEVDKLRREKSDEPPDRDG